MAAPGSPAAGGTSLSGTTRRRHVSSPVAGGPVLFLGLGAMGEPMATLLAAAG